MCTYIYVHNLYIYYFKKQLNIQYRITEEVVPYVWASP